MYSLIVILILVACILLIAVVLIQNPKGGGLSQTFGGFSNQLMGVQRTTDFLEKTTWVLISAIAGLALLTVLFLGKPQVTENKGPKSRLEGVEQSLPTAPQPQPSAPANNAGKPAANQPPATQQPAAAQPAGAAPKQK